MLTFLLQSLRHQREIGTFVPSSPFLARAMTEPARRARGHKRVLEVGPGTGAFTTQLLSVLRPGDEAHLVECNEVFAERLEERVLAPFRREHPDIEVVLHCASIEDASLEGTFDYIVCSLPFKVFEPFEVRAIFRHLMRSLAPGGRLTYMEYAGVRVFKTPLLSREGRRNLYRVEAIQRTLPRRHNASRRLVLLNILPAFAIQLGHHENGHARVRDRRSA